MKKVYMALLLTSFCVNVMADDWARREYLEKNKNESVENIIKVCETIVMHDSDGNALPSAMDACLKMKGVDIPPYRYNKKPEEEKDIRTMLALK